MIELAEHVAEVMDVGPGTRVFEVDCGSGDFLFPFYLNGYVCGGCDADAGAVAVAEVAMPDGVFQVAAASLLDPALPWDVVVCRTLGTMDDEDRGRGVLARMFAKATHAIAVLDLPAERQQWLLHALAEVGASAIQFEASSTPGRVNAFARA